MTQGFIRNEEGMKFIPVTDLSKSYAFQDKVHVLGKPIDKYLFEKVKEVVNECEGLDDFGSFDEDPEEACMQAWLVQELIEDDKHIEVIKSLVPETYVAEIEELLENCITEGGGFRPTLFADSDNSELFSAAENIESEFNEMEFKVTLFAASLASEKGYDLDSICYAWEQNGWDEEVEALKAMDSK